MADQNAYECQRAFEEQTSSHPDSSSSSETQVQNFLLFGIPMAQIERGPRLIFKGMRQQFPIGEEWQPPCLCLQTSRIQAIVMLS